MNMSDEELLREYARTNRQAAFGTLVERHLNLVYSVARRHVRSAHLAEEVAQSVFVDLARSSTKFPAGTPVIAWLHLVSRRTAIDAVRRETRRRAREIAAVVASDAPADSVVMNPSSSPWTAVEPLLDEAVASLPPSDRTAILLRFFESRSLREVGAVLGTTEDAAQKRVSRALEQMRTFFARRGIAVTAAGLGADLAGHALQMAPSTLAAGIAKAIGALPVAIPTAAVTSSLLTKGLAGIIMIASGTMLWEGVALHQANAEIADRTQRIAALAADVRATSHQRDALRRDHDATTQNIAALRARDNTEPKDNTLVSEMRAWLDRVADAKNYLENNPQLRLPELSLLKDNDWFEAVQPGRTSPAMTVEKVLLNLRGDAKNRFANLVQPALNAYLQSSAGMLPKSMDELLPFFDRAIDPAILTRYTLPYRGRLSDLTTQQRNRLIVENPTGLDEMHVWIGSAGHGVGRFKSMPP